ncbi:hypothetical protein AB0M39_14895 [Streptomyces sp. NPDC051907]|uniref:hypothetical protein n=1 Tax=Streptomyces sp. NPDC051907 TaxID=3155284 RepID=UPI00342245F3
MTLRRVVPDIRAEETKEGGGGGRFGLIGREEGLLPSSAHDPRRETDSRRTAGFRLSADFRRTAVDAVSRRS